MVAQTEVKNLSRKLLCKSILLYPRTFAVCGRTRVYLLCFSSGVHVPGSHGGTTGQPMPNSRNVTFSRTSGLFSSLRPAPCRQDCLASGFWSFCMENEMCWPAWPGGLPAVSLTALHSLLVLLPSSFNALPLLIFASHMGLQRGDL